jgi:hypothetical protein
LHRLRVLLKQHWSSPKLEFPQIDMGIAGLFGQIDTLLYALR